MTHVIFRGATEPAGLALETLPPIAAHGGDHIGCELEAGEVGAPGAVGAAEKGLGASTAFGSLVLTLVAQAKVARQRFALHKGLCRTCRSTRLNYCNGDRGQNTIKICGREKYFTRSSIHLS